MIILTTHDFPGKEIKEVLGLVSGNTVQCKHLGKDFGASFKNLIGREMVAYKEMLDSSREIAISRMIKEAESKGANAIIGLHLSTSAIVQGAAEIIAYGTAIIVE